MNYIQCIIQSIANGLGQLHPDGAGVAQRLCNGLPRNDPGFDSWWGRCKSRASCPSQGIVNGGGVSKLPRGRWDVKPTNQPTNFIGTGC